MESLAKSEQMEPTGWKNLTFTQEVSPGSPQFQTVLLPKQREGKV